MKVLLEGRPVIITLDGPAGTGKSSVARTLAARLGLDFLDTGAMYRAATAIAIDRGIPITDEAAVVREVVAADLVFDWKVDPPRILAFGVPIDHRTRDRDVTALVSPVAAIAPLRREMVAKQRHFGAQHPRLVSEGRDQGSVVFPNADVKFYMDASPEVRAQRRFDQLTQAGLSADYGQLLREIEDRDRRDSSRADGPLICPTDAVRVDTSNLRFDQVVQTLEDEVRRRVVAKG
ncbi:MAG: (d)CMP kinase [Planctomycetota bacterium]